MTLKPIKIEIVTSCISDVERIIEAVRNIRVEKMCSTHKAIKTDFKKPLDYLLLLQLLDQKTGKSLV